MNKKYSKIKSFFLTIGFFALLFIVSAVFQDVLYNLNTYYLDNYYCSENEVYHCFSACMAENDWCECVDVDELKEHGGKNEK